MTETELIKCETPEQTLLRWSGEKLSKHMDDTAAAFRLATTDDERAEVTQEAHEYYAYWEAHNAKLIEMTSHPGGIRGYLEQRQNDQPNPQGG